MGWASGGDRDLEDEHDGSEDGHDQEAVNEDGGDINDERHDGEGDDEPDADTEDDPGHREPTQAQRERYRNRPYGDPLTVTVAGQKVRASTATGGRMFKPEECYFVDAGNGHMIKVVGIV